MRRLISSAVWLAAVCLLSACGSRELLSKASLAPDTISPNGDGVQDATIRDGGVVLVGGVVQGGGRYL